MSSKSNRRRHVRMDRFKAQIAEQVIGEDSLIEVELGPDSSVTLYIPLDPLEAGEFGQALREAGNDTEAGALVIFGHNPNASAEEQLAKWKASGYTLGDLVQVYQAEATAARERLGNFRYNG